MQRGDQIWPELGFHNQHQFWVHLLQETAKRIGQIIRKVNVLNIAAKSRLYPL